MITLNSANKAFDSQTQAVVLCPMAKQSLNDRIKESVGKTSAPSMIPDFTPPPPVKEEVAPPDLRELVDNARDRLELLRLINQSAEYAQMEREAAKARKPITDQIKKLLGKYEIGRCVCDGNLVNYYNAPRSTLSKELLLVKGVSPLIINECTVTKDSYTLRITPVGEDETE